MIDKKPSQADRLYKLLSDYQPHRTDEIVERIYGQGLSLARVGARIWDIKKRIELAGTGTILGWKDPEHPALYFYQMISTAGTQCSLL